MRLIDADKIIITRQDYVGALTLKERLQRLLNLQPTVEAIPIDWIMWEWRRNQPDDTQEDAWMRLGVLKMLRDWRKENSVKISGENYDSDEEHEEQMRCLNEN